MADEAVGPSPTDASAPRGRIGRLLSGTTGGVLWMVIGGGVGQLIALAVSPLLTRVYTVDQFGLFTIFVSITSITGTAVTFRLEAAIPLPESHRVAASVAWLGIGLGAACSLVIGLLGPLVAGPVARLVGIPALAGVWWWVAIATLAIALDQVLLTWMVREQRYKALAVRNFLQGAGQGGFQVAFGYVPFKSVGLLIGWIGGRIVALGGLFSEGGLFKQGMPGLAEIRSAASRYRRFPLVASWAALLNVLGQQAPFLVISAYYGAGTVGLLNVTLRVLSAPVTLIGQAVARVFQGEASAAVRDGTRPLRPIIRANTRALVVISVPLAAILIFVAPPLFSFVFGAEWRQAGVYTQILALGYAAQLISSPISQTLLILEKQGAQLAWDASRMVITVGGPLLVAVLGASATVAIVTLSIAYVICYGALWWTCVRVADRYDRSLPSAGSPDAA